MNYKPKSSGNESLRKIRPGRREVPYPQSPEIEKSQRETREFNRLIGWLTILVAVFVIGAVITVIWGVVMVVWVLTSML